MNFAEARDFAVRRRFVFDLGAIAAREAAGLDETVFVEQVVNALTCVEVALGFALGEFFRPAHADSLGSALLEFLNQFFIGHNTSPTINININIYL